MVERTERLSMYDPELVVERTEMVSMYDQGCLI